MSGRLKIVDLESLLRHSETVRALNRNWASQGYSISSCRIWRRSDKSFTARVVWRNRDAALCTVACTLQGAALP